MPIYEYKCTNCSHSFAKLIRNNSELPTHCPECAAATLKKMFSTFSTSVAPAAGTACPAAGKCPSGGSCSQGAGSCPF